MPGDSDDGDDGDDTHESPPPPAAPPPPPAASDPFQSGWFLVFAGVAAAAVLAMAVMAAGLLFRGDGRTVLSADKKEDKKEGTTLPLLEWPVNSAPDR